MTEINELVYWYYFDGNHLFSKKLMKEHIARVTMTDSAAREILETGYIAALNQNVRNYDPYFKLDYQYGFTRKAKAHRNIYYAMQKKHPELENSLKALSGILAPYGEYVYINMGYLNNYVNPLIKHEMFLNEHFIHREKFTVENILTLIEYRPQAMMGGEIKDYQEKNVPEFIKTLKSKFPDLYRELLNASDKVKELDAEISYVGKTAYVNTLAPGMVELRLGFIDKQSFYWDGQTLTNTVNAYDDTEVKQVLTPSEKTTVTILEDVTVLDTSEILN